ncbi:MAG: hypothetical protein COY58_03775 [Gammaproteobacteria bacterium CG_4_10_14_0_8_um_filter_38_16]|nr:MAG: hypothetical protein COY58_03775 [Gammaproteobacteria bacterium CG_4_10_14_0_8_um_filter_38_16]PJA03697.1 MAG: hypothetical protein COX72_04160 [Gammaproteobacteria bacterium CG_4_10_14_0_2_um_filter_38_22]PJB09641.1 MAG: hypothetical protein CO120_08940 [Gammaproteobacteria bacterium CG_4_9_14_3_um_filter_38_9]
MLRNERHYEPWTVTSVSHNETSPNNMYAGYSLFRKKNEFAGYRLFQTQKVSTIKTDGSPYAGMPLIQKK